MKQQDIFAGEPLDVGRAETLLFEAWLLEAGSEASVLAACVHRVLVLDVELESPPVGYRGGATESARRTLVGTFEPLRAQYEADLDSAQLAWQLGAPPEWLDDRVQACLATNRVIGARVVRWAEDEVAEIATRGKGQRTVTLRSGTYQFVGMSPPRLIGAGDRSISQLRVAAALALMASPFFALMARDLLGLQMLVGASTAGAVQLGFACLFGYVGALFVLCGGPPLRFGARGAARRRLLAAGAMRTSGDDGAAVDRERAPSRYATR